MTDAQHVPKRTREQALAALQFARQQAAEYERLYRYWNAQLIAAIDELDFFT
jgi:hypothetical protein